MFLAFGRYHYGLLPAGAVRQSCRHLHLLVDVCFVANIRCHHDGIPVGSSNCRSPHVDVYKVCCYEPYVTVYAGAAVPSAVFLPGVVGLHHNLIVACTDEFCYVAPERRISVGMSACNYPVDLYLGVLIYSLEIQPQLAAFVVVV